MFATLRAKSPRSERIRKDDDKTVSHQSIRPLGVQLCLGVWSLGQSAAIMQGNYCRERAGTVRAIKRPMQDQAVIWNIDLLRCSNCFRTGEGGDENKGQDAVSHDFCSSRAKCHPALKLSRRVAVAQGGQDHKLVVRPGCRLAFRCGARVIMFWLPENAAAGAPKSHARRWRCLIVQIVPHQCRARPRSNISMAISEWCGRVPSSAAP